MMGPADLLENVSVLGRRDSRAGSARILVGIKDQPGLHAGVLSLNHKDPAGRFTSATEFVASRLDETIAEWRTALELGADPARPFAGHAIVVEDAAPDTCLALIALEKRLKGEQLAPAWLEYAGNWELGFTDSTGTPVESFGALLGALVHFEFEDHVASGNSASFASALRIGMAYAAGLSGSAPPFDPAKLPRVLPGAPGWLNELHNRAHARLAYEAIVYRNLAQSAIKAQLAVRLAGSERRTIVDAIIFGESELTSSLKVFIRSDPNTFTGRGYAFQAIHRPSQAMTGNDMTISSAASARLDLRDLWLELERLEDSRWSTFESTAAGIARPRGPTPSDNRCLPSHDETWCDVPPCHQPWYDENGRRTLIAAPRGVSLADGSVCPGTRLTWSDVKDAIWRLYAPTLGLRLRAFGGAGPGAPLNGPTEATEPLRCELIGGLGLYAVFAERADGEPDVNCLWTPTLKSACATFIEMGSTSIDRLLPVDGFDFVDERGGVAIVSDHGVLVIDMERDGRFPSRDIDTAVRRVAGKIKIAVDLETAVADRLRVLVEKAIGLGSESAKRDALKAIFAEKLKVRRAWRDAQNIESDVFVRRIRSLCETRWSARERLDGALSELDELERMVVSTSEVRTNSILDNLAVYGLPLSLAGNILGSLVVLDNGVFTRIAPSVIIAYLAVAALAFIFIWLFSYFQRRNWNIS